MWAGHFPWCECPVCASCRRIGNLLTQGSCRPGFNDKAAGLLECTERSLQIALDRSALPVPVAFGGLGGVIASTPNLLGGGSQSSTPSGPAQDLREPLPRSKPQSSPTRPPGNFSSSTTAGNQTSGRDGPAASSQTKQEGKAEKLEECYPKSKPTPRTAASFTGVKIEPSEEEAQSSKEPLVDVKAASPKTKERKKSRRKREEDQSSEEDRERLRRKRTGKERSKTKERQRSRSKRGGREKEDSPRREERGKEKKYPRDKPPEPGYPPPGRSREKERGERAQSSKGAGKGSERGSGWRGRLPRGFHDKKWGKNKGIVKRAKQSLWRDRYG